MKPAPKATPILPNMAARFSDWIVLPKDGRVLTQGLPADVVTPDTIREAYGVEVDIRHDDEGVPMLNPLRSLTEQEYDFSCRVPHR